MQDGIFSNVMQAVPVPDASNPDVSVGLGNIAGALLGGNPMTALMIAAGSGLLSSLLSSGKSEREQSTKQLMNWLESNKARFGKPSYSKEELKSMADEMKFNVQSASDVAAGRIGSAIGESGVAEGQPLASYYTQELAPVIAQGQFESANIDKWATQLWASMDEQSKQNLLNIAQMQTGLIGGLRPMSDGQTGFTSFFQGANMAATGLGNLSKAWTDANYKPPGGNP